MTRYFVHYETVVHDDDWCSRGYDVSFDLDGNVSENQLIELCRQDAPNHDDPGGLHFHYKEGSYHFSGLQSLDA